MLNHYPGKPDGMLVERITNMIWTNMIEDKANCVIDFHTRGGWGEGPNWVNYPYPGPSSEKSEELAKAFGTEFVFRRTPPDSPEKGYDMRGLCHTLGIPNFAPEGGSGGFEFREDVVGVDARGIINVMKKLGMIEGKPELPKKQYIFDGSIWEESKITASKAGFFVSRVKYKQMVKKGDILGGIYSMRTLEEIETLRAHTDGIVFYLPEYPLINAGESPTAVLNFGKAIKVIENP